MNKRVVVVDNYDSFTYNLVQYIESLGGECDVRLNDRVSVEQIREARPAGVLLSPGPGNPDEAGVTLSVIEQLSGSLPIFGVCLGHQAIGQAFGGKVIRAPELMPLEELWRGLKAAVAANRCYASLEELAERAVGWLDTMGDEERRRRCALHSSKFDWLPT